MIELTHSLTQGVNNKVLELWLTETVSHTVREPIGLFQTRHTYHKKEHKKEQMVLWRGQQATTSPRRYLFRPSTTFIFSLLHATAATNLQPHDDISKTHEEDVSTTILPGGCH